MPIATCRRSTCASSYLPAVLTVAVWSGTRVAKRRLFCASPKSSCDGHFFRIGQSWPASTSSVSRACSTTAGTFDDGLAQPPARGRIAIIIGRGRDGSNFPLIGDSVVLGRERGDIMFPKTAMSRAPTRLEPPWVLPAGSRELERRFTCACWQAPDPSGSCLLSLVSSSSASSSGSSLAASRRDRLPHDSLVFNFVGADGAALHGSSLTTLIGGRAVTP